MSKTIDQKVVEMRFDNQHFEKNVSTTLSLLDKLKQKLNLDGASKGLENVQHATRTNMVGLSGAVEQVSAKFSALQIIGTTALVNITNQAVNAGKRIVSALTIEPITTGFREYELKMGSVQTIMASTGESLATVNQYLEELNEYSDQTIYSFSDMTQNIGKFTNAGVKLEDAVMAIKGISNEAAVSGANANEASRAMYNFAQALSTGYVKLIDWKSIENANMATVEFKEQLIKSALEMGTVIKVGDKFRSTTTDMNGKVSELFTSTTMFNDSLSSQWMTTDVLVKTLREYADVNTDIGKKASQAATEVKTFTQLFDTLKESAQSGWAQTWELIVGDFEEAKGLMTKLSKSIGGIIDGISDWRNDLIGGAMMSKWEKLSSVINKAGFSAEDFQKAVMKAGRENGDHIDYLVDKYGSLQKAIQKGKIPAKTLSKAFKTLLGVEEDLSKTTEEYGEIVEQVLQGKFGNGEARIKALTDAGYDYARVQNIINEKMGSSVRHVSALTEEQIKNADALANLSYNQLKQKGYTDEQIKALKELKKYADESGTSINELMKEMSKSSGRELLIESFENLGKAIGKVFDTIKEAWNNVFDEGVTSGDIYSVIEKFQQLTESMIIGEETADNFRRILEGVFSALDISWSLASMSLMGGLKILNEVLKIFGTDIMGVAAYIADYISAFNDWIEANTIFGSTTKWNDIARIILAVYEGIRDCVKAFLGLEEAEGIITGIKDKLVEFFNSLSTFLDEFSTDSLVTKIQEFFGAIETWITEGHRFQDLGAYIMQGLQMGISDEVKATVGQLLEAAKTMISNFCSFFGIHSPSKLMMSLGAFIMLGLVYGLKNGVPGVYGMIETIADGIFSAITNIFSSFGGIDFGTLLAVALGGGLIFVANKMAKAIDKFANPFDKLGGVLSAVKNTVGEVGEAIDRLGKAKAMEMRSAALLNLAKAIALFTASVIALTFVDPGKLWEAVKIIAALSAILVALSFAMEKISGASVEVNKNGAKLGGFKTGLIAIAGSLLILAVVVKIIGSMDMEQAKQGFLGLLGLAVVISSVLAIYGTLVKGKAAQNITKAGGMLIKLSIALLLMVGAAKLIAGMSTDEMKNAAKGISAFVAVVGLIMAIGMIPGKNVKNIGKMMLNISVALLLMVGVAKLINTMSWDEMGKAAAGIAGLIAFIAILMTIAMIPGKNVDKLGTMLLGISGAIMILALTAKLIVGMEWEEMGKAAVGLLGLSVIIGVLIGIVRLLGSDAPKMAATLLALSVAIGILAAIAVVLSLIDVEGLKKGIVAVGLLSAFMALMIWATRGASDCKGNLIVMTVAIGIMVASVALLSTIDTDKLAKATGALSILMLVFAGVAKMAGTMNASIGALVVITLAVGMLGFILYQLAELPVESVMGSAAALSILLLSIAGSMAIISLTGPSATAALPALAAMIVAVGLLALILGALTALDCAPSMETAMALSVLLLALTAACALMAGIGAVAGLAITGALAFDAVLLIIGGLLVGIGALMKLVPEAEEFLDKGLEVLNKLAYGLGEAVGNIVAGFADGVMSCLPGIAESLSEFMQNLVPFIEGVKSIDDSFEAGMTNLMDGIGAVELTKLLKLETLGLSLSTYGGLVSATDVNSITNSVSIINKLSKSINALANIDASGVDTFKKALDTLAKVSVEKIVKAFKLNSPEFETTGKKIVSSITQGLDSKKASFENAVKLLATAGSDAAKSSASKFVTAGEQFGSGLVIGISSKWLAAYNAGYALGQAAVQGEKDGQQSKSPSKLTEKAGKWLGEGLIVGMKKITGLVYNAGSDLGSSATDPISDTISRIGDMLNEDIDMQPTIRPVLDLSDVSAGAGMIDGMFDNPSLGVLSNLGSIKSMVNSQNGAGDVVSAIDKLSKSLSNLPSGDTINIDGITYDDGSNISNAVRTIVGAARRERRA